MGLDLWFREDVERILDTKNRTAARYSDGEYKQGYLDALDDIAAAFGLGLSPARPTTLIGEYSVNKDGLG